MENKSDVLLRIPKDTLVKDTRFPEIWNLLLGDESIFRETDKYYEIPADDDSLRKIAEAAIKECSAASSPGVRVADLLAARTRTLDKAVRSYKYNEESREVRQLPKIIEGDRTLGAAIFKMIAEVAGAQGKEAFFEPLSQRVLEADEWMMGRGEVEQAKSHLSEKANVSFLVISPESGVLTVCPADKIDAYETKVRDPLAKRGFLAAFAGGPWDKGFQSIFVGSVHDWYTSADGATADEKKTMESAWEAYKKWVGGVGRKSIGEMLVDGANDEKVAAVLSIFFHAQGQNHTKCPIQTSTGVQGALHLGMLPGGVLRGIFQRGRDGGISGGKESMRGGVFPSEAEGEEIAQRYGSTWTPAIRAARLGLIHQSMEEVKSGSVHTHRQKPQSQQPRGLPFAHAGVFSGGQADSHDHRVVPRQGFSGHKRGAACIVRG